MAVYEVRNNEEAHRLSVQQKQFQHETQRRFYMALSLLLTIGMLSTCCYIYRLRFTNQKLQHTCDQILQLNQTRDYFFGIIAHDLRRPLSSFQDMAELINYYLTAHRYTELEKVSQSIDRMGKHTRLLLDNLLNRALTQCDEVPYHPEKIVLSEKIAPVVELYQQAAHFQNVTIKVECPQPLTVFMDSNAFALILRNLLDNALKNSRSGGNISIKASLTEAEKRVRLTIEDNGKGMNAEKLETIRQTLQHPQLHPNRPHGMGMILLGHFIKRNRGDVSVNSSPEKGTIFSLTFPM